jgi:hypothetical protein
MIQEEKRKIGVISVKSNGLYNIKWLYNDHVVVMTIPSGWAVKIDEKRDLDIQVFFEEINVTDKYIEKLPNRKTIRPTLDNLQTILKLIDENVDDYIQQLEGGTDGEDAHAVA